jgi:hypothetical protein
MAEIGWIDRARIAMKMLHMGQPVDDSDVPNDNLKISAAIANKYGTAFYENHGPQLFEGDGVTPRDPTNVEKAQFFVRRLNEFCRNEQRARERPTADAAAEAHMTTVETDIEADLGPLN